MKMIEHEYDLNDFLGLLVVLRSDLDEGLISYYNKGNEFDDLHY